MTPTIYNDAIIVTSCSGVNTPPPFWVTPPSLKPPLTTPFLTPFGNFCFLGPFLFILTSLFAVLQPENKIYQFVHLKHIMRRHIRIIYTSVQHYI